MSEKKSAMQATVEQNWIASINDVLEEVIKGTLEEELPASVAIGQIGVVISEILCFAEIGRAIPSDRIPKLEEQKKNMQQMREKMRSYKEKVQKEETVND